MIEYKRVVVCAACKYGDIIIAGARHYDKVMHSQLRAFKESHEIELINTGKVEQGFIDQYGIFMDRVEALRVATQANQINIRRDKTSPKDVLFSEDLY